MAKLRETSVQNKLTLKKDNDNIREIDGYLDDAKDGIISNIKITIMDLLKTNSFNINKTITCSNF